MTAFVIYDPPTATTVTTTVPVVDAKKPTHPADFTLSASTKYKAFKGFTSRTFKSTPANSRLWKLEPALIQAALKTDDDEWKKGWLTVEQARECGAVLIEENFDPAVETLESVNIGNGDLVLVEPRELETTRWPMDPPGTTSTVTAVKPLFQSGGYVESLEKSAKIVPPSSASMQTVASTSKGGFLSMFTRSKGDGSSGQTEKSRMGRVGLSNL